MYEENKEIKEIEEVRQKPTYYTTLPWQVRYDNSLTANEKILFSELLLLSKKTDTVQHKTLILLNCTT